MSAVEKGHLTKRWRGSTPVRACILSAILWGCSASPALAGDSSSAIPDVAVGAFVYNERCALCHGPRGMGEGVIPLNIEGYPATNLRTGESVDTPEQIRKVIALGNQLSGASEFSPPWGNELSWTEVESVASFVELLRNDNEAALALLDDLDASVSATEKLGRLTYQSRCTLCHGQSGLGDGKMSKIIKTPPPFDLTLSTVPDDYLRLIISNGGEAMGRSAQMPPWRDELNSIEIDSVIIFLKTLRQ